MTVDSTLALARATTQFLSGHAASVDLNRAYGAWIVSKPVLVRTVLAMANATLLMIGLSGCGKEASSSPPTPSADLSKHNAELQQQIATLTQEREALKAKVEELSSTPAMLLDTVRRAAQRSALSEADAAQQRLEQRYPQAAQVAEGRKLIALQRESVQKAQEQAQQLQALGFKALQVGSLVKGPVAAAKYGELSVGARYVFSRYDDSYHYRDADRDTKFALVNLTVTANKGVNDPDLPGAALYWADGGQLRKLGDFDVEFARWESFATYLGNYSDSRNDFAKTQTISFNLGVQINDDAVKKRPLYVVATRAGCMARSYERFRNPPVSYGGRCALLKDTLVLGDFGEGTDGLAVVMRRD